MVMLRFRTPLRPSIYVWIQYQCIILGMWLAMAIGCDQAKIDGFSLGDRHRGGGSFIGANPVLSPSGTDVFYSAPTEISDGAIFRFSLRNEQTVPINVKYYYQGQVDVSPDGRSLCYVSEASDLPSIWLSDLNGLKARQLTRSKYAEDSPIFSKDGQTIAFVRRLTENPDDRLSDEIFVIGIDGQSERRITNDRFTDHPVRFSRGDKSLYYLSTRAVEGEKTSDSGEMNLFRISLDEGVHSLVLPLGLRGAGCDVSADEEFVVYIDDPEKPFEYDIYVSRIDGSKMKRLTNFNGYIGSVRFGFHSRKFTFLQEPSRDGCGDIYFFDLRKSIQTKIHSISCSRR